MTVSLIALLCDASAAAAADCATGNAAPPADIATPTMLFDALRSHTSAELLSMGFLRKPVEKECAWIYEVKVLTASGSVVELDFKAEGLDLVGARGPNNDRDAAALVQRLGGDTAFLNAGAKNSAPGTRSNGGESSGGGSGSGGSGEGGEGGNSGSGSGGSGSGGGGSGSGGSDGGEGGEDGGDGGSDDGGSDGGGEGGEGGDD